MIILFCDHWAQLSFLIITPNQQWRRWRPITSLYQRNQGTASLTSGIGRFRFSRWREFWTRNITMFHYSMMSCIWSSDVCKRTWEVSFCGLPLLCEHDVTFMLRVNVYLNLFIISAGLVVDFLDLILTSQGVMWQGHISILNMLHSDCNGRDFMGTMITVMWGKLSW